MRKYAFILAFLSGTALTIAAPFMFMDSYKPAEEFDQLTGMVKGFPIRSQRAPLMFMGHTFYRHDDVACVEIAGALKPFRTRDSVIRQLRILAPTVPVTIIYDHMPTEDDDYPEALQIRYGNTLLDFMPAWRDEQKQLAVVCFALGAFFVWVGVKELRKFRENRRQDAIFRQQYNRYNR